jgi:hypothetical protein
VIALTSFIVSSSFAQDENMPRKKPAKKEHVMKKKVHRPKKHAGVKKSHKMKKKVKEEKEDSRIKVN